MLQHDGGNEKTSLVFAAAVEKQGQYKLIPASEVCELLKYSEVKCTSQNGTPEAGVKDNEKKSFPMWIFGAIGGLIPVIIIVIVIVRKRRMKQVVL